MNITIGSRGSDLALWQAHFVKRELEQLGHRVGIKIIITKGDRVQNLSFDKIEGKGFFTKEIEEALLSKEIDLAVHSHKDLETTPPAGLKIGAVSYRANPADQLLVAKTATDTDQPFGLKKDAVVGTSSARRKSQMMRLRPDITLKDLRGNVPTRINKLREGQYDAIILATAGIERLELDLSDLHCVELDPQVFVPAPAQGVLGLQIRENDPGMETALEPLNHPEVAEAIRIERGVLKQLEGGCQLPLGVFCKKENDALSIHVSFASQPDSAAKTSVYTSTGEDDIVPRIVADLNEKTT